MGDGEESRHYAPERVYLPRSAAMSSIKESRHYSYAPRHSARRRRTSALLLNEYSFHVLRLWATAKNFGTMLSRHSERRKRPSALPLPPPRHSEQSQSPSFTIAGATNRPLHRNRFSHDEYYLRNEIYSSLTTKTCQTVFAISTFFSRLLSILLSIGNSSKIQKCLKIAAFLKFSPRFFKKTAFFRIF